MKSAALFGITIVVILISLYEWPKIKKNQNKEKWSFVTLTMAGWLLAVLLIIFPEMPGPTQWIDIIFKPLGKLLEK